MVDFLLGCVKTHALKHSMERWAPGHACGMTLENILSIRFFRKREGRL